MSKSVKRFASREFLNITEKSGKTIAKVDITPEGVCPPEVKVPCGDCHVCCHLPMMLRPGSADMVMTYEFNLHTRGSKDIFSGKETVDVSLFVRRRLDLEDPTGDRRVCVYLEGRKCSIYERRPASCREFDCRVMAHRADKGKLYPGMEQIFASAIERGRVLRETPKLKPAIPGRSKKRNSVPLRKKS